MKRVKKWERRLRERKVLGYGEFTKQDKRDFDEAYERFWGIRNVKVSKGKAGRK
jgi:hypothetical protein